MSRVPLISPSVRASSPLYAFLKPWVRAGAGLFFRRIEVHGAGQIPRKSPVILVANHQNAMLDPVMLCVAMKRQLHWLTRSDVFVSSSARRLLFRLNMLPVFRERDRIRVPDWNHQNHEVFERCFSRLRNGAAMAMFPEGTHRGRKQLHLPLKKGVARLAFGALRNGVPRNLVVVPVGLDYSSFYDPRGSLLIHVGRPIHPAELLELHAGDEQKAVQALMAEVESGLRAVMIDIRDTPRYEKIMALEALAARTSGKGSLHSRMVSFQRIANHSGIPDLPQWSEPMHLYARASGQLRFNEQLAAVAMKQSATRMRLGVLLLVLFAIPAAAGRLVYSPLRGLVEWVVATKVKDPLFNNSIRLAGWTFLSPVWTLLMAALSGLLTGSWLIASGMMVMFPVCGIIAMFWGEEMDLVRQRSRLRQLRRTQPAEFEEWRSARTELIRLLRSWPD